MKTNSSLTKSFALSLSLCAGAISGKILLDNYLDQTEAPEFNSPLPYTVYQPDTITLSHPLDTNDRATVMNMYNSQHFIPLEGQINQESAAQFMRHYQNANTRFDNDYFVTISINSRGGSVNWGNVIANQIKNSMVPTRVLCTGQAASMAAMILITTENVFTRDAQKECTIMLHAPYDEYVLNGQTVNLKRSHYAIAQNLFNENPHLQHWEIPYGRKNEDGLNENLTLKLSKEQVNHNQNRLETMSATFTRSIAKHSHLTEQDVSLLFEKGDVHFNAFEARFLGLIDHIENPKLDKVNAMISEITVCMRHPDISPCNKPSDVEFLF